MPAVPGRRKVAAIIEPVTYERIALRAYELYLQREAGNGDDVSDWLIAERELTQAVTPTPTKRTAKTVAALTAEKAAKPKTEKASNPKTEQASKSKKAVKVASQKTSGVTTTRKRKTDAAKGKTK